MALAALAAGVGAVILFRRFTEGDATPRAELFATFLLQIVMVVTAIGLGPLRSRGGVRLLGLEPTSRKTLFAWGLLALLTSLAMTALYGNLVARFAPSLVPPPLPPEFMAEGYRIPAFASVVIVAPFAEELFFRGFVFAGLTRRFGMKGGLVVSALAFAAGHPSAALVVPVFLSGAIFAVVYWRTGTLWPAIFAHMMQNAIAFALTL